MARKFSGPRLRAARTAAKLSRAKLAIGVGRTAQSIYLYERESVTPPVNVLAQIADFLDCRFDDLLVEEVASNVA
ncbi:helix-turn-helix domain-containing protein [Streptosporangium roseum]|uniref:HTH cro/C1-type domain-containing protein n=1 Tax=Streptosporangium roseum (strain ATCC 12428 / DSM 43021 / JCM 3005 / KCTC 9067 / NCIMB 10171 / NRRL 2505 / NI 9100) TaxID=479432 RepID=D2AUI2_STRRD|nr:helix-turn-helix transcriptional regulator [Streptosporangium roseum]ACZ84844.1 hypothetical protein Sros_1856 [Streptosporangium roseum DSM 43021]